MVMSDVVEAILFRCLVKDLLLCKSVCKSWYSLISSPSFAKTHVKFICNKEEDNTRKIDMIRSLFVTTTECGDRLSSAPSDWAPYSKHRMQDDYKVVMAICQHGMDFALVRILSLKSNIWKDFGQVYYRFDDSTLSGDAYENEIDLVFSMQHAFPEEKDRGADAGFQHVLEGILRFIKSELLPKNDLREKGGRGGSYYDFDGAYYVLILRWQREFR
ncbi:putative F-box domain containing protein, partial [Tanacetum coccineum]